MECQAPQRLDENGNVRQEYIDFMKKIPSPEERAKMTDDEILDWFISRRGGNREVLKYRIGKGHFEEWICLLKIVKTDFLYNCRIFKDLKSYISTFENSYYITKENMIEWFRNQNWLSHKNEMNLMNNLYKAFYKEYIYKFRLDSSFNHFEQYIIEWSGYGLDNINTWATLKNKPTHKIFILLAYCVDGKDERGLFEF